MRRSSDRFRQAALLLRTGDRTTPERSVIPGRWAASLPPGTVSAVMGAAERRVVSVVFADLVDFTALSERLDAEDVAHIQDSWFALAAEAVTAAGGEVEKFIGDAVMATFGAAQADDTDPVRAVRAALAIAGD